MPGSEGAAAEAIRAAETALARQNSVAAHVDLEVVAAVLNAHAAHAEGTAELQSLQSEIATAVTARTGLDTPTGARELQRYLLDKLADIRAVVERTDLDDTSKATLAAALASLYASSGSTGAEPDRPPPAEPAFGEPDLLDGLVDAGPLEFPGPQTDTGPDAEPAVGPAVQQPLPGGMPSMPALPSVPPLGGGMPGIAPLAGLGALPGLSPDQQPREPAEPAEPTTEPAEPAEPAPDYSEVIAEAVSGTPIADAFDHHGVDIPGPGTPVGAPLDAGQVVAGDIAVFDDRHALALGNGKALLDEQIQPIETVNRPGFLGWQHPPDPIAEPD